MAIKFECPNCHKKLSVKDELAGKKGKCPECQKNVVIPAASPTPALPTPALPGLPPPPTFDGPVRTQEEIDLEAMEALIDKPKETDKPQEVVFDCPMCGEKLTLKADIAGKRAPCPECRRIIKVPELEGKQVIKDWRQMDTQPPPPTLDAQGNPQANLGASDRTGLSQEAKEEFDLIPEREKPLPLWVKLLPYTAGSLALVLVVGLGWGLWSWLSAGAEATLYAGAVKVLQAGDKAEPESIAALHRAAGLYHFQRKASDSAAKAREHFETALATLSTSPARSERDCGLLDLALAIVELSGDRKTDPDVERGFKFDHEDAQKLLTGAFRTMANSDARREAIRLVARRLAKESPERALALAGLGNPNSLDRAEAQAIVGLEFLALSKKELAERAIESALQAFAGTKDIPAPSVYALGLLLGRKMPEADKNSLEAEYERIGRVEALARDGKISEARTLAAEAPDPSNKLRRTIALASVTAETDGQDVEAAIKLLEGPLRGNQNLPPWLIYRLVQVAAQARLPVDRLNELAKFALDPAVRGRGQLVALRQEVAGSKAEIALPGPSERFEKNTISRLVATEILCRHNTSVNSSWGNDIQGWEEKPRAFGALGILQGRYSR